MSQQTQSTDQRKRVIVVGAGFAGIEVTRALKKRHDLEIIIIDRRNYHLFQPLLYQVAMAGLNAADIAEPIRSIFSKSPNITVYQGAVLSIDAQAKKVKTDFLPFDFDYLVLATGAVHHYFGNDAWEAHAPGLKTLAQATEMRLRVLSAFEEAEKTQDLALRQKHLTFVIVGAGPTGVELAGAIAEMRTYTLRDDFQNINSEDARVILINARDLVLNTFAPELSGRAAHSLKKLGVELLTNARVTEVTGDGVFIGDQFIPCSTVLWAAGVKASPIGKHSDLPTDQSGRIFTDPDLSVPNHPNVFVAGDLAHIKQQAKVLAGVAPVAMQSGKHVAKMIIADLEGKSRRPFRYFDKGSMATIGRSEAIVQSGKLKLWGWLAWIVWLLLHVVYLVRYRNRFFTLIQWGISYFFYRRGARLIIRKTWERRKLDKSP